VPTSPSFCRLGSGTKKSGRRFLDSFARTKQERLASGDPRLSLEESYGTHEGYVLAVTHAANDAVTVGYLLPDDATALIQQAGASNVLNP
jgi:hypothetical protein